MADTEKTVGRGRGKYTVKGAQADQEARITALEDIIADAIEAGEITAPPEEETEPEA